MKKGITKLLTVVLCCCLCMITMPSSICAQGYEETEESIRAKQRVKTGENMDDYYYIKSSPTQDFYIYKDYGDNKNYYHVFSYVIDRNTGRANWGVAMDLHKTEPQVREKHSYLDQNGERQWEYGPWNHEVAYEFLVDRQKVLELISKIESEKLQSAGDGENSLKSSDNNSEGNRSGSIENLVKNGINLFFFFLGCYAILELICKYVQKKKE